ncbi:MAG: ASCH domain-containing protein [Mucilaginibacter sp.]|uniref:ASCH domain-containing protein n=1 Tax=Mucilaginibacter sp. TaxID=1882438 RepID=UPI003266BE33
MKALTIKQPWAGLIVSGAKDIENRTWKTNFRGRIYVHASAKIISGHRDVSSYLSYEQWDSLNDSQLERHLTQGFWTTSAIVGEVDIVDCVLNHPSVWAEHKATKIKEIDGVKVEIEVPVYNWVLANAVEYDKPILNVKGKLSFWEYLPSITLI